MYSGNYRGASNMPTEFPPLEWSTAEGFASVDFKTAFLTIMMQVTRG